MIEDATRKRDRLTVRGISRRPSAWLAWLLWALVVVLGEALIIPYQIVWYDLTHLFSLKALNILGALMGPIVVLAILAFATVGAAVATLRPRNGVGWLCLAVGLLLVVAGAPQDLDSYGIPWRVLEPVSSMAWALITPPLPVTLMLLIFPDGRLPSRRWWAVVAVASAGYFLTFFGMWKVGIFFSTAALLASVAAVVLRWRRSTDQERQQLKWLAYVVALVAVVGLAGLAGWRVWTHAYVPTLLVVTAGMGLGIPAAIAVAVLKYRLYDIDLIINRTLVYGLLTATLVAVYLVCVWLLHVVAEVPLQYIFHAFTGETSTIPVVISTLVMATLFNPLRRRIQGFIDKRFYRSKYDARKTLEAFSSKLRDETDLEALRGDLVGVVRETMQPAHVSLWLREPWQVRDSSRGNRRVVATRRAGDTNKGASRRRRLCP